MFGHRYGVTYLLENIPCCGSIPKNRNGAINKIKQEYKNYKQCH